MVVIALYLKLDLENVQKITIPSDYQWCFDMKQSNSDELRKNVFVSAADTYEIEGGIGAGKEAHFVLTWPGSKKSSTLSIVNDSQKVIEAKDSGEWVSVIAFDCRGLEPVHWYPSDGVGWIVHSASSDSSFENVILTEDDWADYDEKGEETIGLYSLEHKFEEIKGKKKK